ncbi:MAG: DUF3536 domain-containing protein [Syntrophobacteraceae bacterium]
MDDLRRKKYVCIHGHFYQPPRENPWLEETEREDSAIPYHDWNERINMECYRANTAARLVDEGNRILNLRNNYRQFSFNFGPTLIQWLERHDPWVYQAIIDSDRESVKERGGHGNAIAQVYNHVIMPLANQRDKVTQVRWGIRDFESRFGRRPEGMWLAETAVDRSTLAVLAEAGIKFTILSPYQAARWRFIGKDAQWREAPGGSIPTGRAYRYDCGAGRYIHIFFYDAALAHGVAFDRVLEHSGKFLAQIDRSHDRRDPASDEPWLVNTATDGESYGHHFKFGDMALAAAFQELERDPMTEVTNYGSFLEAFPVVAEAEILENTAWSCAHGLGRWSADCGCHIGGEPNWNQKWRGPLRAATEYVRDAVAVHFEKEMKKLCRDPWRTRNEYIDVVLARKRALEKFLQKHMNGPEASGQASRFLELCEMQRYALYMFTSCGWFFDEISQLEALLVLKYAARAMQLAEKTGSPPIEPGFLKILERAPSNVPAYGNGANVYLKKVKPEIVEKARVAANYAIKALALPARRQFQIYTYAVMPQKEVNLGASPVPCLYGHLTVEHDKTLAAGDFLYAVLHFGGLDFRCSVKPYAGDEEYRAILDALQDCVEEQNTAKMLRLLDEKFGAESFGLHDAFKDLRSSIALEVSRKTLATYTDLQRSLFQTYKPLIFSLKQWGIKIPSDLRVSIRRVLGDEAEQVVGAVIDHERDTLYLDAPWDTTDFFYRGHMARLNSLLEEAKSWGVSLQSESLSQRLGLALVESATRLVVTFDQGEAGRFFRLLSLCTVLDERPETWKLQTLFFEFVTRGIEKPDLFAKIVNVQTFIEELDRMLWCRFERLFRESPAARARELVPLTESRAVLKHRKRGSD